MIIFSVHIVRLWYKSDEWAYRISTPIVGTTLRDHMSEEGATGNVDGDYFYTGSKNIFDQFWVITNTESRDW